MLGSPFILVTLLASVVSVTQAAALKPRQLLGQLGSLQCNIARVRIVGALGDADQAIGNIQDQATSTAAAAGLSQANAGISQIANAILAGEEPPAESRSEVQAGLEAMAAALTANNSTDPAVGDAQSALTAATAAGEDVVAQC
ncbi:hypothetical protein B0J13DRAFT_534953 [Dactylonectria estremocensis]|uniref:Uncharacterized protein n=1 Tax=Dactylonectria estremocensis TaxID=1079267 RepID=A0A9P9FGP6_9HYPO|nr:hypothetical protein B0J13DRAFT_534953 [Dactylonectria estremocensis]